ncbi:MAG: hypothetical protein IPL10_07095 [Bacteroidetes bacterium]|nr:hypothetical protein [Bacteroidota bacterium]
MSKPLFSQTNKNTYKTSLPNNLNWNTVQTEFYKLLNELRQQQKTTILTNDGVLSLGRAPWCSHRYHDQKRGTPQKRWAPQLVKIAFDFHK